MAITRTTHFYEFLARLDSEVEAAPGMAHAVGMHLVQLERISEGATIISERPLSPVAVGFEALAAAMSDANLAAAVAAFAAEIETRQP